MGLTNSAQSLQAEGSAEPARAAGQPDPCTRWGALSRRAAVLRSTAPGIRTGERPSAVLAGWGTGLASLDERRLTQRDDRSDAAALTLVVEGSNVVALVCDAVNRRNPLARMASSKGKRREPRSLRRAEEAKRMIDRVRTFIGNRQYPKYVIVSRVRRSSCPTQRILFAYAMSWSRRGSRPERPMVHAPTLTWRMRRGEVRRGNRRDRR
jgi:hypothetical protein